MRNVRLSVIVPLGAKRENYVQGSLKEQRDKVNILIEIGPNPSENRNRGIKKIKTEFVGFMNGHTIAPNNWSFNVINFFLNNPEIDIVGGPQITSKDENNFGRICGYALSSPFGSGGVYKRYCGKKTIFNADESHLTSANLICRKKVFEKVRFDESIYPGEDPKFISDAKFTGFKIAYSPEIIVYNKRRENLISLAKQIFNYGKTRPKKEKFIVTLKKPYFVIPTLFFLYLLFLPTLAIFNKLFFIPVILYFMLMVIFTIIESIKNKDTLAIILLPFIFFIIHMSYGGGFLYGLLIKRL